jgi:CheY-like chemotaxis protein
MSLPFKPDEMGGGVCSPVSSSVRSTEQIGEDNVSIASLLSGFIKQDSATDLPADRSAPVVDMSHLKILVVDDSTLIQKGTSRALQKAGHKVEVAQHGAQCLKVLKASQLAPDTCQYGFDLILMDLQMPVMDGFEATRRIRALERDAVLPERDSSDDYDDPRRPHIIIIGVTANTEGEAKADCIGSGMDGFIEKPLKIADVQKYFTKLILGVRGGGRGRGGGGVE